MRRRPIEFWWICLFAVFQVVLAFRFATPSLIDHQIIAGLAIALLVSASLLMFFSPLGRLGCMALLGIECGHQALLLPQSAAVSWQNLIVALIQLGFCAWMICYLYSSSTGRLCRGMTRAPREALLDWHLLDLLEITLGAGVGYLLALAGADVRLAGCVGLGSYVLYGLLLEDWLRHRWLAWRARVERGFPVADAGYWTAACRALTREDLATARREIMAASPEAREHPAGKLFLRVLEWQELLCAVPQDGGACLRRIAHDHDYKPGKLDRNRIADYIECSRPEEIRALVDSRAELLNGLVRVGLQGQTLFADQADRHLARITGEAFQFNAPESWAAWWEEFEADWSGDGGAVSLVVRLLRLDADDAAHALACRVAGRAEEPLLKELTGQMHFLNAMQKAMREGESVEPFIKQPQRLLLVPEISDAVGLLHADSQLLEGLGMTLGAAMRRLHSRVPLVDYIGRLWHRYPHELGADMPWVIKTLTNKNLGVLRARARFRAWWPDARAAFLRHDHAVAAGLAAYGAGDEAKAEAAFRDALNEQPRELSSRYNLALCLMRRQAHAEAARLLQELTRLEPKEYYWWLVLGEMHRNINRSADAHAAFRRALELGAAAPQVALHRALIFARDDREAEAIKQLDRVLGVNPSSSKIDTLVARLESEGLWKLAGHYREMAFRRGLATDPDGDEREGAEDVSA